MIMSCYRVLLVFILAIICVRTEEESVKPMTKDERVALREEARKMFYHAYNAYMDNAYPADELMPLSCKGRWRGVTPSRGDMDDVMGNFSLTLVDSLDTLAIMGDFSEFSHAMKLVIQDVTFDHDIVVSVFETNIRMIGGLLSAHVLANKLKHEVPVLSWYNGELLEKAEELARRLLPAFNTSTGIPHGRVNLRHGIRGIPQIRETCTACAGTMILEMAALSRLTGDPVFEQKAHRAMDGLWNIRHRTSELMGTVIDVESGEWVRKEAGVGAGIDSYYEYCLKAYILLADETYLARFTRHYNAVMKYISRGPILLAVQMHRPQVQSRHWMDALLAFWPGLQVLAGEVRRAVELHEMLYQVVRRHTFLPEAFTGDLRVHWAQHPLRPEFLESTYLLHRATGDEHYLRVGERVLRALQRHARVPCGYAAVGDVRTRHREDRMDSFVLAETFKYLYLLFGEDRELPVRLEDYVLTTEAHFLPLEIANMPTAAPPRVDRHHNYTKTCPSTYSLVAERVRGPTRALLGTARPAPRLRSLADPRHLTALADMGISVLTLPDGRVQLLYTTNTAKSSKDAAEGLAFMREMSKWNTLGDPENGVIAAGIKIGDNVYPAGPGHFGTELSGDTRLSGTVVLAQPDNACDPITNAVQLSGNIAVAMRGHCTFAHKARHVQTAGARALIVIDNVPGSSHQSTALFAMSADGIDDITIPAIFLFTKEGNVLLDTIKNDPSHVVTLGELGSMRNEFETCEANECTKEGVERASVEQLQRALNHLAAMFELGHETRVASAQERCPNPDSSRDGV